MESHESRRLAAHILLKCRRVPSTSAVWGRGKVLLGLGVIDPGGGRGNGRRDERSCGQGDGTGNGQDFIVWLTGRHGWLCAWCSAFFGRHNMHAVTVAD